MSAPNQMTQNDQTSTLAAIRILFHSLSENRRRALLPLLALMMIGAFAELVTLGALLPFLSVLAEPDNSSALEVLRPALDAIGAKTHRQVQIVLASIFALGAVSSSTVRLILLWAVQKFVYGISCELGIKLYADSLSQTYAYHIHHNTSEIIASIAKVESLTNLVLMPVMNSIVACVIAAFIVSGLIAISPSIALISGASFVVIYILASLATRSRLRRNAQVISRAHSDRVRSMQEGLGGIRDVLLDRSQSVFVDLYSQAEADFRDARTRNSLYSNAPRFVVEGAGMVVIAIVAVSVTSKLGSFSDALPLLGALALGAHRLLPLAQQIYLGWANANGNKQDLVEISRLLSRPVRDNPLDTPPIPFTKSIILDQIGFSYSEGRSAALSDVNFTIPRGSRVGIIGKTGSGKSTLMDLILGLLEPTEGEIRIDGVKLTADNRAAWQRNIAHVPQAIFLTDSSIAENIAFGVDKADIDMTRVVQSAIKSELSEFIEQLPERYDTRVGERGIQLSGGQKQRIGIARALYKQATVLILDEATSALDTKTEEAVISAIDQLDSGLTIFMIAHRLSTLRECDLLLTLDGGRLISLQFK